MLVLRLFGVGLLIGYGCVEEPPLLFRSKSATDSQVLGGVVKLDDQFIP
jgi:hypothetical protein